MKAWVKNHPLESMIIVTVFAFHLLFIFYNFKPLHSSLPKQSLVVRTHFETRPQIISEPKPKFLPAKKKTSIPSPRKKEAIFQELQNALSDIEEKQKSHPTSSPVILPQKIQTLHIDQSFETHSSYLSFLVATLQENLKLPEEGNVCAQLTILKSGRVEKVEILYAESEKNQNYLEKTLMNLDFPTFSNEFNGKMKHTFNLNFCHEK